MTWKSLSPPVPESSILGKWYAVIYTTKKSNKLLIGKVLRRFLNDVNGPIESVEFRCLKPKVFEDTPCHLPDIGVFKTEDIIYGPVQVICP